ncbi:MAG: alkaline phosphatase [Candidatus Marinimicrobia bacterium]|nr:alkaline phosphatase [Candidatus Neomarinimicrobiota bacterium]
MSVILFIGDGMGVPHLTWDYYANENSPFRKFPVAGLVATDPAGKSKVGESAASATALATGHKVEKGMISVDDNGERLKTVLEVANEHAKATGIVTTTSITHATPAAFVSHVLNRGMEYEIAAQICSSNVDVLMGGGLRFFEKNIVLDTNLISIMINRGYFFVSSYVQLEKTFTDTISKLLGLFAYEGLKRAELRTLTLKEMTRIAVEVLDNNPKGFFLMVEGGQIDWRGHEKDEYGFKVEMKDFTDAINWALDYQRKRNDLLIVVVGDHETGGLVLKEDSDEIGIKPIFTTNQHTASFVAIFAKGPWEEKFCGLHEIADIGKILIDVAKR